MTPPQTQPEVCQPSRPYYCPPVTGDLPFPYGGGQPLSAVHGTGQLGVNSPANNAYCYPPPPPHPTQHTIQHPPQHPLQHPPHHAISKSDAELAEVPPPPHAFFPPPTTPAFVQLTTSPTHATHSLGYNHQQQLPPLPPLPTTSSLTPHSLLPLTSDSGLPQSASPPAIPVPRYYGDYRHDGLPSNPGNHVNNVFGCHGNIPPGAPELCTPFIAQPLISRDLKRPFYINNIMHANDALQ